MKPKQGRPYPQAHTLSSTVDYSLLNSSTLLFASFFFLRGLCFLIGWDVSAVTDMSFMLYENGATITNSYYSGNSYGNLGSFNADIIAWDVSSVTDMVGMFYQARVFDKDLSRWDTAQVTTMQNMFKSAAFFSADIKHWDVGKVTSMRSMFRGATDFNSEIGAWNVSAVVNMRSMFRYASRFNSELGAWNVYKVTDTGFMFSQASSFNDPTIAAWDASKIFNFDNMFKYASSFNVDLSPWNLGTVTYISVNDMFQGSSNFNQVLCWDTTNIYYTNGMFSGSSGTSDSTAPKCACSTNEFYNGTACLPCPSGTVSFGKTSSCTTVYHPTSAPTVTPPPTNSFAPTTYKTPIDDKNLNTAMNMWFTNEEAAEVIYGHISGEIFVPI